MGKYELATMQQQVGEWADATFIHATDESIVAHLFREWQELAAAVHLGTTPQIADELADMLLLMFHLAHRRKIDLGEAAEHVHEKNLGRVWGQPDHQGVVEHVAAGRR